MRKEGVFIYPPNTPETPPEVIRSISPEYIHIPEKKEDLLARWGVEQSPKSVQDALFSTYALEKYARITHKYANHKEFLIHLSQGPQEPKDISRLVGKYFDLPHYAIFDSSLEETEEDRQLRRIEDLTYYFSQSLESRPHVQLYEKAEETGEVLFTKQSHFIYYLCGVLCDTPYEQRARESLIAIWNKKFPPDRPDGKSPKKVSKNPFFVRIMGGLFSFTPELSIKKNLDQDIADGTPIQDCVSLLSSRQRFPYPWHYQIMPLLAHSLSDNQREFLLHNPSILHEAKDSYTGDHFLSNPWLLWRPRNFVTNYEHIRPLLATPTPPHLLDFFNNEDAFEGLKIMHDQIFDSRTLEILSSLALLQLSTAVLQLPHRQLPQKYIHDIHTMRLVERPPLHQNFSEILQSHLSRLNLPIHLSDALLTFLQKDSFSYDARDKETLALFLCEVIKKIHSIKTEQAEQGDMIAQGLDLFHDVCKKIREDIPYRIDKDDPICGFSNSSKSRGLNCSGSAKLLSYVYDIIATNIPGFEERHPAQLQWFSDHVRIVVRDKDIFYAYDHGSRCIADTNILNKTPLDSLHGSFYRTFKNPLFDPQNPPPPFRLGPTPSYIPPGHTLLGQFMSPSEHTPNLPPPDFASHSQTLFAQSSEIAASALQYGVARTLKVFEDAGFNTQLPQTPPSLSDPNSPSLRPLFRDPFPLHNHSPKIQESSSPLETIPKHSLPTTPQTLRRIAQGVGLILGTSAGYSAISLLSQAPEGEAYVEAASLELTEVHVPEIEITVARNAFVLGADDIILNPDLVQIAHKDSVRIITLEGGEELTASPHLFPLLVSQDLSHLHTALPTPPPSSQEERVALYLQGDQLQARAVTAAFLESAVRDGYLDRDPSWTEIDLFINDALTVNIVRDDQEIIAHVSPNYEKSLVPKQTILSPEKYKELRIAPLRTKSAQQKILKTAKTLFPQTQ